MKGLNQQKVALTLGLFAGGAHLVWSLLVVLGWAQPLLDFIFWLHMVENPLRVVQFSVSTALFLIIVTFIVGYVVGWVFSWLWNKLQK
jgi:heme/copper-type cytochrome/quinol oxidase subunit 4